MVHITQVGNPGSDAVETVCGGAEVEHLMVSGPSRDGWSGKIYYNGNLVGPSADTGGIIWLDGDDSQADKSDGAFYW